MNTKKLEEEKLAVFNYFWNNATDNIFILILDEKNKEFTVKDINPSQLKALGLKKKPKNKKLKDLIEEDKVKDLEKKYLDCLEKNTQVVEEEIIEQNEETKYFKTTIIPIIDEDKKTKQIIGISKDLTQIQGLEKKLKQLNDEIEVLTNKKNENFEETQESIKQLVFTDSLTGIGNRRYLDDHATKAISLAHRYDSFLALLVLDIDELYKINDEYGYILGDEIIKEVANLLKNSIRESDILARYSGEEFFLLLPMTSLEAAQILGNRLLQNIRALTFKDKNKSKIKITASLGLCVLSEPNDNIDTLLQRSFHALSKAKKYGKNQMVSYLSEDSYKVHV